MSPDTSATRGTPIHTANIVYRKRKALTVNYNEERFHPPLDEGQKIRCHPRKNSKSSPCNRSTEPNDEGMLSMMKQLLQEQLKNVEATEKIVALEPQLRFLQGESSRSKNGTSSLDEVAILRNVNDLLRLKVRTLEESKPSASLPSPTMQRNLQRLEENCKHLRWQLNTFQEKKRCQEEKERYQNELEATYESYQKQVEEEHSNLFNGGRSS